MAYAPNALKDLYNLWHQSIPSAVFSGIVSSYVPRRGYHFAANQLPTNDYSRQLAEDRIDIDVDAASALDVSQSTTDMMRVTRRFYDSWKNSDDPRLNNVREVIGTLDGRSVIYMDCQSGEQGTADDTHLWHNHVGVLRRFANDGPTMLAIASVVKGETLAQWLGQTQPEEEDDDMSAIGLEIPVSGIKSWTIPPVEAGPDARIALINITNDSENSQYALRIWINKGEGPGKWSPAPNTQEGGWIVLKSGDRYAARLPAGTSCVSIRRPNPDENYPKFLGNLTWALERGPLIKK